MYATLNNFAANISDLNYMIITWVLHGNYILKAYTIRLHLRRQPKNDSLYFPSLYCRGVMPTCFLK